MNERLRLLREEIGISRAAFGQRIGVSGDVINNLERGRVEIKEHILKLICSEFSVNEDWLRTGIGEMFLKTPSSMMEQLKKEFGFDEFISNLVHEYLKLDPTQRKNVRDFFYRVIESEDTNYLQDTKSKAITPSASTLDIDVEVEEYRRYLELEREAGEKSSVSQKDA